MNSNTALMSLINTTATQQCSSYFSTYIPPTKHIEAYRSLFESVRFIYCALSSILVQIDDVKATSLFCPADCIIVHTSRSNSSCICHNIIVLQIILISHSECTSHADVKLLCNLSPGIYTRSTIHNNLIEQSSDELMHVFLHIGANRC